MLVLVLRSNMLRRGLRKVCLTAVGRAVKIESLVAESPVKQPV